MRSQDTQVSQCETNLCKMNLHEQWNSIRYSIRYFRKVFNQLGTYGLQLFENQTWNWSYDQTHTTFRGFRLLWGALARWLLRATEYVREQGDKLDAYPANPTRKQLGTVLYTGGADDLRYSVDQCKSCCLYELSVVAESGSGLVGSCMYCWVVSILMDIFVVWFELNPPGPDLRNVGWRENDKFSLSSPSSLIAWRAFNVARTELLYSRPRLK